MDIGAKLLAAELDEATAYYEERTPDLAAIEVPVLSCGNWGGHGVHLRGNVHGWLRLAGSKQKWMEFHGREHWTEFCDYSTVTALAATPMSQVSDHCNATGKGILTSLCDSMATLGNCAVYRASESVVTFPPNLPPSFNAKDGVSRM